MRSTDARSLEARSHHSPPGMSERAEDSKPGPRARAGGSASHKQVLRICSLLIALVGMGLTSRCLSAQVTLQLQSSRIWNDEAAIAEVTIRNPPRGVEAPELPAVRNCKVTGPHGPEMHDVIINGRRSSSYKYHYRLVPLRGATGNFTIGPVTVPVTRGKRLRSRAVVLQIFKRPTEAVLFECKVQPSGGPVGAPFRVEYTIYYAGKTGGSHLGLQGLDVPILTQSGVRVKPIKLLRNVPATDLTLSNKSTLHMQQSFSGRDGGYGYSTLVFGLDVTPLTTGTIDVGGASVNMQLFTGKTAIRTGLFGRRQEVAVPTSFAAHTGPVTYNVEALPEAGRPPGFTGAVGNYRVSVKASPAEVAAFDPITLKIRVSRVSGTGLLEELKPAAWNEIDSLIKDFQVSTDVDSGNLQGRAKIFKQILRPRNETVTAIPPIPFPFYDPSRKEYRVAYSEAIPIQVRAVKTVGADAAMRSSQSMQQPVSRAPSVISHHSGIGANFQSLGEARPPMSPRKQLVSLTFAAALILPPLLFVLLAMLLRFRGRDASHRKKAQALSKALAALADPPDAVHLSHAYEGYFRDRLELPAGEVTPADLAGALARQGVPPELHTSTVNLLERIHAEKFGGAREATGALVAESHASLQEVERCLRG